jgi:Uma2 family endonuclease
MTTTEISSKLTYDDYVNFPNDGKRYEIIDGELYVNPSPNMKHQRVLLRLAIALSRFVEKHRLGEVFIAPFDVVFSEIDVMEPDLLFISTARMHVLTQANVKGAPDLVVEVLSDGTRRYDETTKRKRYEHFEVQEYWIVDPIDDSVRILRLEGKQYERIIVGGDLTSPLFPGFSLGLKKLFAERV